MSDDDDRKYYINGKEVSHERFYEEHRKDRHFSLSLQQRECNLWTSHEDQS